MTTTFTPESLTKVQRSILLYAETCMVDYGGLLEGKRMNADDIEALEDMQDAGLLRFGRVPGRLLGSFIGRDVTHWVEFTDAAWALAFAVRRFRAEQSKSNSVNYRRVREALDAREEA